LITPKRRRMASVLDDVRESTKVLTPASTEVPGMGKKSIKETAEAVITRVEAEVGPSVPAETGPAELIEKDAEQGPSDASKAPLPLGKERTSKESEFLAAEASTEGLEFIVCHAAGKNYQRSRLPKLGNLLRILSIPQDSWCLMALTKTIFCIAFRTRKYLFVERWQKI
jgi:hypothetical protein